jgi:Skp family chaperone for outer membrane proteins
VKRFWATVVIVGLATAWPLTAEDSRPQAAVVNIPDVLAKSGLLQDELERINAVTAKTLEDLEKRAETLKAEREKLQERRLNTPPESPLLFGEIQALQKKEFEFQNDFREWELRKQRLAAEAVRKTLLTIQTAIRKESAARNIPLVLHCSDPDELWSSETDDSEKEPKPAENRPRNSVANIMDATDFQLKDYRPKTWRSLVRRFGRNPILFNLETIDITDAVIKQIALAEKRPSERSSDR